MRPAKINDAKLIELIDVKKYSAAKAGKELGVSRQAVSQRLKQLKGRTTRVIVAKETGKAVQKGFDALDQLNQINQRSLELLEQAQNRPEFALRCIAELRNQIRLVADIQLQLFSLQEAQGFMEIVRDALKEASPDAYRKFKDRINNERSLRGALRIT